MKCRFIKTFSVSIKHCLFILLLATGGYSSAQYRSPDQLRCDYAGAFARQDIAAWKRLNAQVVRQMGVSPSAALAQIQVLAYYGSVAWYIRTDLAAAQDYTDSLSDALDRAERYSQLATFCEMMRVSHSFFSAYLSPWLSPYYVGKAFYSFNSPDAAVLASPYYWTELGNTKYHVPDFAGRDYRSSALYYGRSAAILASDGSCKCNWYYLNTLLWQARSLQKQKKVSQSLVVYRQIVTLRPDFDTVRSIIRILERDSTARF